MSNDAAARLQSWIGYLDHAYGIDSVPDDVWSDALGQWERGIEPPSWQPKGQ